MRTRVERPLRITIGTILIVIYGVIGIGLGILLLIAGFVVGGIATAGSYYGSFSPLAGYASIGVLALGGVLLVMGIVGIVCGWWLWKMQVWGAAIGIVLLVAGMILALVPLMEAQNYSTGEFAGIVWAGNVVMIILLMFSWNTLSQFRSSQIF